MLQEELEPVNDLPDSHITGSKRPPEVEVQLYLPLVNFPISSFLSELVKMGDRGFLSQKLAEERELSRPVDITEGKGKMKEAPYSLVRTQSIES
ncbi:hypothetical protein E5288_WYG010411 [Bos mutus]|uniref:Uncharacterized protein n=1 Tax=Bos mutus TaxID=72004 RepID=A0A6B0S9U6_9CETA|nr:hypothetical protein [Bos mutus]